MTVSQAGSRGGEARAKNMTAEERSSACALASRHAHVVRWAHKYVCPECGSKAHGAKFGTQWKRDANGWYHLHAGKWIKAIKSEPSEKRKKKV